MNRSSSIINTNPQFRYGSMFSVLRSPCDDGDEYAGESVRGCHDHLLALAGKDVVQRTTTNTRHYQDSKTMHMCRFIYTCLSVGMAVCLSTVFGHAIANCFSNSALCIYVVALTSLLLLEVAVVVLIFFDMNWSKLIIDYINEHYTKFRNFVVFHLHMCRFIVILIVVLQIFVVIFAIILWSIGTEPRYGHRLSRVPDFKQSFLVGPNVLLADNATGPAHNGSSSALFQTCITCGELCRNRRESLVSYLEGVIRVRFQQTTNTDI